MCGILIFKTNHLTPEIKRKFKYSLEDLKNRGPDEIRTLQNKNLLAGFTRLSINDIKTGSQPFKSLCGKYIILFNGEIVNYKTLASNLRHKDIKMKYGHEAEVIIQLFILYGEKCVDFLRGFFAFVIIETKTNNIFAAVDRFRIKPLYYFQNKEKNFIILTSDFSTLFKNNLVERELNISTLSAYFSLARTFDNSTIFKNIKQLTAATVLKFNNGTIKTYKYWHPYKERPNKYWHPYRDLTNIKNKERARDLVHNKLLEVMDLWQISEAKLSLALSSGVDSQLINHYFNRNKINTSKFHLSESKRAFFQLDQTVKINPNAKKILSLLNEFTKKNHDPFSMANAGSTGMLQVYDKIKFNKFKVCFTGEGADEIFGGYDRYRKQLHLMKKKKLTFSQMMIKLYKNEIGNVNKNFHKDLVINHERNLIDKINSIILRSKQIKNKILEFDQICYLPVLLKTHDSLAMHSSIESRPPYLDHEFVELVNEIPTDLKFTSFDSKIALRQVLKEKFNYTPGKKKIGTPSYFRQIMQSKHELNNYKEIVFYGESKNFLEPRKIIPKIKNNYESKDEIFLWRLYILNKILYKF